MPAVPHTETAFFPYSFSCLLCFDDGHLPGRQGIEPPVLPLAGGTVKFHMHSLAGFNRIPVDVGVHQLQAQALRSAFLRLEDKFPALPLIAGSFADPILYGKYGDNFSLYFNF